ncbi:2-oxo-4-hydroxy-4-carboxy-5-ureidoimidazoline decarboxylase [Uliginosibacterium gangwonense]|uniref:2-oxo-4-hydroxy-4-carboxy-5-ureidoimidazoline decarboxylase n=1 Tax=Uliginosibacterium gangwonense TaxID=392736 RepID=UPI0003746F36|nr:2-oxo-4-hydroxy-4-carboxy-5-ureidoimidazoline decarboxylase [Uliginosibacterium gangwonense]
MSALQAEMAVLSALDQSSFVSRLDGIFEHSPWVAERAWLMRPFEALEDLQQALCRCMRAASADEKLALIRAHPELAGKAAMRGEMAEASVREQSGARLDACSPEEYARLHQLNTAYREKFGFPFILAVRGLDRAAIIAIFANRLENVPEQELEEALLQIERIACLRLHERFAT